jgi:putative transposase
MVSPELLRETLDTANLECWERERTTTPVIAPPKQRFWYANETDVSSTLAVQLHATSCSLRERQAILRLFGVQRSHKAVFRWVHRVADSVLNPPEAQPKRVAVDETVVKVNDELS